MKIYFAADLEKRKFEGRTQTALALKKFLEDNGHKFVDKPQEADIIHFHSSGIIDSFKAAMWKKKYKKPVVYTLYSISKTEILNHFRNHFAQNFYLHPRKTSFFLSYSAILPLKWRGLKLKELDAVVVPSNFVRKRLFKNTKLIRIGIDTKHYKSIKNRENGSENDKIKVGYFGHPSVYKGVIDFARASKKFPKNHESYVHVTKLTSKIKKTLHKINPKLNVQGLLEDIRNVYNKMDIVVLPYRSFLGAIANPLVLMETMACEKAIVTTNFEYIKEISQGTALIIKPYSPQQIVKAVRKLENEEFRKELGKKSRAIITSEFNQEKCFQQYLELYNQLI